MQIYFSEPNAHANLKEKRFIFIFELLRLTFEQPKPQEKTKVTYLKNFY